MEILSFVRCLQQLNHPQIHILLVPGHSTARGGFATQWLVCLWERQLGSSSFTGLVNHWLHRSDCLPVTKHATVPKFSVSLLQEPWCMLKHLLSCAEQFINTSVASFSYVPHSTSLKTFLQCVSFPLSSLLSLYSFPLCHFLPLIFFSIPLHITRRKPPLLWQGSGWKSLCSWQNLSEWHLELSEVEGKDAVPLII